VNDQSKRAEPKDPRVEAALRDYLERVDRGEPVDREEFLARHALIADQLRTFIAAEAEVRKLAGAQPLTDRSHDSTKSLSAHGQETIAPQSVANRAAESGGMGLAGQFGRYRIIRALGKGAMGMVYLAEDTQLERSVAIKTPNFEVRPTDEMLERFYREARAAATLRHANICPVHDVGQIDGTHYISMAYIEGRPLSAFIQPDKPQTERQVLIVIRKLALALQVAHDKGIVHRDLKPSNIMVDTSSEPIIMDFGLAQQIRSKDDVRLTQTGNILGTPAYMSPEQVEGEPDKISLPTDQYSLGVILYELLTCQLPFRGSLAVVMAQILTHEPPPPSQLRPDLDPRIEAVCLKMMAKIPSERFGSLKAVADELAGILKSPLAKGTSKQKPASAPALPGAQSAADRMRADVGASQVLKSLKQKKVTESDWASLEELARKCDSRHDYDQVIQIIERIPEDKRDAALQELLEKSLGKVDEISFLICEIDAAVRLNDPQTALKKADNLLAIKPGHHRAREIQELFAGQGEGGAARIGLVQRFTQPWNEGGWIPWSALAFGLTVFGVMMGVIIVWLGRTAVVIDAQVAGINVAVNDQSALITVPGMQSIKVEPGDKTLTISYAGLETKTKSFTIKTGETKIVAVSILNSQIVARLEGEIAPLTTDHEEKIAATPATTLQRAATLPRTFTNSLGMEFVLVPKGKSWLGGGGGSAGDKEVVIAHDFYLGKYEVTQEEWKTVTGLTPSSFSRTGGGKDAVKDIADAELNLFPVEHVSWDDAQVFLERLNQREKEAGWVYCLPKAAEWEYACRGGPLSDKSESAYDFYFDKPTNQLLPVQANFGQELMRTCKVGSYQPNRLGLYDMHGNVWEWCDDTQKTANGASFRVHRGGCWGDDAGICRSAVRHRDPSARRDFPVGLRVARVPVGKEIVRISPADAITTTPAGGPKLNVPTTAPKFFGRPFLVRGEWAIESDELVQPTLAMGDERPVVVLGEESLSNYDLSLEVKKTGGRDSLGIFFHWLGPGHHREFSLLGNGGTQLLYRYNGKIGRENGNWKRLSLSSNRWYSLKVETRGDTFRAYLDGVLQFEQTDARFTHGRICLFTNSAAARFRRIQVSDPQGKVLFEGLPELPPASNNTTPKANIADNPRLPTAGETAAKSAQKQWAERSKTPVISTNSLGMKLALIPPGEFAMGSPASEKQREDQEQQHRVRITNPFYLGVYEITQSEFEHVMGRNPSWFLNSGGQAEAATGVDTSRYPVESVTWYDAVEFCNKLSEKEGRRPYYRTADIERYEDGGIRDAKVSIAGGDGYRLPTEAEWEYACRAGTTTPFNFGTANNGAESNCIGTAAYRTEEQGPALGRPVPVGSYRPNAFGLYDMHGNVLEWCWDVFDEAYYKHSPESDPAGPSAGSNRVRRGGGWGYQAIDCRSAFRRRNLPRYRSHTTGIRVARVPDGQEVAKIPPEKNKPADVAPSPPAIGPNPSVATTVSKISGRPFLVRGQWTIENDELVQPKLSAGHEHPLIVFGEPALSHYDLTLEAKETGGNEALGIFFHWLGPGRYRKFFLAANRELNFSYSYDGKWSREDGIRKMRYSSNRWYSLKVEVRGDTFRAYLDGVLQFEQTDGRFTHGRICLFTNDTAARFRRIKVSDPRGKVLFEGLPELPPPSNKTAP
jgi:formylglycine-generating enzyme required for sulfatase activity/serine/threonine protein kinase